VNNGGSISAVAKMAAAAYQRNNGIESENGGRRHGIVAKWRRHRNGIESGGKIIKWRKGGMAAKQRKQRNAWRHQRKRSESVMAKAKASK
jgi:hypothetical protein